MNYIKNKINSVILVLLSIALVGCNVDEPKYDDESCIKNLNDLRSGSSYDISKATNKPCFSQDISVRKLKTHYTVNTAEGTTYEPYTANEFIDQDTADRYNAMANTKNETAKTKQDLKIKLDNVYMNVLDDDDNKHLTLFFIAVCIFFFYYFLIYNTKEEQEKNSPLKYFSYIALLFFSLSIFVHSEIAQVKTNDLSIKIGTKQARVSMINALNEVNYKSTELLRENSNNEALVDTIDFIKTNVCMSNNQKYYIENKELLWYEVAQTEEELIESYFNKNKTYIIGNEEVTNIFGDVVQEKARIGYHVNNANLITGVVFEDCAEVKFVSRTISDDMLETMNAVEFSKRLSNALDNKAYEDNARLLISAYYDLYGDTLFTNNLLSELIVLFTNEYKKGLIFGYIIADEGEQSINSDNLTNLQSYADSIYDSLNEAQCLKQGDLVKDTQNHLEKFKADNTIGISKTDCVTFTENEIIASTLHAYAYHKNEDIVDEKIRATLDVSEATVLESSEYLIDEYAVVNDAYISIMSELSSFDKTLAFYWNQGAEAHSKFLSYLYSQSNDYINTHAQIIDVSRFDYSQALPSFTLDPEPMIDTSISQVNAIVEPLLNQIDKESDLVSMNVANSMLEYKLDDSSFKIGDALSGDLSSLSDSLTDFKNATERKLSSFSKMTCNGSKSECDEILKDYDGVQEWNAASDTLIEVGTPAILVGTAGKITFSATEAALKYGKKKQSKNTKQAKFGKRSKAGVIDTFNSFLKGAAETILSIGFLSVAIGFLMKFVYHIPAIPADWFYMTQYFFSELMNFLPITVIWIVILTKFSVRALKYGFYLIACMFVYQPLMSFIIPTMTHLMQNAIVMILNIVPSITALMIDDSSSTLGQLFNVFYSLLSIFLVILIGSLVLVKSVISIFRKITSVTMFDSSASHATQLVNRVESSAKFASGLSSAKVLTSNFVKNKFSKRKRNK